MSQQPALIAPQWTREPMFFLEVKVYTLLRVVSTPNSWSTVGHAGFIMDNLIASGKAKPMTWSCQPDLRSRFSSGANRWTHPTSRTILGADIYRRPLHGRHAYPEPLHP